MSTSRVAYTDSQRILYLSFVDELFQLVDKIPVRYKTAQDEPDMIYPIVDDIQSESPCKAILEGKREPDRSRHWRTPLDIKRGCSVLCLLGLLLLYVHLGPYLLSGSLKDPSPDPASPSTGLAMVIFDPVRGPQLETSGTPAEEEPSRMEKPHWERTLPGQEDLFQVYLDWIHSYLDVEPSWLGQVHDQLQALLAHLQQLLLEPTKLFLSDDLMQVSDVGPDCYRRACTYFWLSD